jgi:integrase/recombinase XerC
MIESIHTNAGTNYLTEKEEKQLFNHLRNLKDRQAERDYTLLKTMRLLGLRRVETCRLNVGDVYRKTRLVVDARLAAKGCTGELDISVELQRIYSEFFKLKRTWGEDMADDAPLFVSRIGERLAVRSVNDLVAKWMKAAGIEQNVTPHGFRHTKAQRIVNDERHLSPDLQKRALQLANRQLRQKSMSSTLIYTVPTREQMAHVAGI